LRPLEFDRALNSPAVSRTLHFALHQIPEPMNPDLSTTGAPDRNAGVDECMSTIVGCGVLVPKRHARRAATRSLIKREARVEFRRHAATLGPGAWVIRLRRPFDRERYPSAQSIPLRAAVAGELELLLLAACRAPLRRP
jgi:ribonuclease P protein component